MKPINMSKFGFELVGDNPDEGILLQNGVPIGSIDFPDRKFKFYTQKESDKVTAILKSRQ